MRYDASTYIYDFEATQFIRDAVEELNALRAAITALASEPGQPHHAATEALKILNQES